MNSNIPEGLENHPDAPYNTLPEHEFDVTVLSEDDDQLLDESEIDTHYAPAFWEHEDFYFWGFVLVAVLGVILLIKNIL